MIGFIRNFKSDTHLLRDILEATVDFICLKDGYGNWVEANDFAQNLLQLNEPHFRGKKDGDLAQERPHFKEFFLNCSETDAQTWRNRKMTRFEERFYEPNGAFRSFDVIKIPFYHQDGRRKALLALGKSS